MHRGLLLPRRACRHRTGSLLQHKHRHMHRNQYRHGHRNRNRNMNMNMNMRLGTHSTQGWAT